MFLKNFLALLATLPAIVSASPGYWKSDIPGYGDGGRYGFKKCQDRGPKPGKVSCINFDTVKTNSTTFIADVPKDYTGLSFSPQFSVINVTAAIDILPPQNKYAAASSPNSLIGSRYNPKDKKDTAPASFSVEKGTFDLFGFYMQPMGSPPSAPGPTIYVRGYPADGGAVFIFKHLFAASTAEPVYFDTHHDAGPKLWDGLKKVEIWATFGEEAFDWEFFVDDIWLRWGSESKSAVKVQELK